MWRIYFGEDSYRSREAYLKARQSLPGTASAKVLRDEDLTPRALKESLSGGDLFGNTVPLAAEGITRFTGTAADEIVAVLSAASRAHDVFFWESGKPQERGKVWKFLSGADAERSEYSPLFGAELEKWIKEKAAAAGLKMDSRLSARLVNTVGPDLWRLSSEIEKMALFAEGGEVGERELEILSPRTAEAKAFAAAAALASGSFAAAAREVALFRFGSDDFRMLIVMALKEIKVMLCVRDLMDRRQRPDKWAVAKTFGIPAFAAQKAIEAAASSSTAKLRALYERFDASVFMLNTGRAEPEDALDALLCAAAA